MKKFAVISAFYTRAPKITIHDVWFLRKGMRQTEFFVILGDFSLFYHPPTPDPTPPSLPWMIPKIKILRKKTKQNMCTINEDHIIYGSWNIRCDRQKFSSFWAIFCIFSPLTTWKIKILTLKKFLEMLSFYTFAPSLTIIWCMVPEIWSVTDIIFCHSGLFFALLPTLRT